MPRTPVNSDEYNKYEKKRRQIILLRLKRSSVDVWSSLDTKVVKKTDSDIASNGINGGKKVLSPLQSGECVWWCDNDDVPPLKKVNPKGNLTRRSKSPPLKTCSGIKDVTPEDEFTSKGNLTRRSKSPPLKTFSGNKNDNPEEVAPNMTRWSKSPPLKNRSENNTSPTESKVVTQNQTVNNRLIATPESLITPKSGNRVDVFVNLSRSAEAERLAKTLFNSPHCYKLNGVEAAAASSSADAPVENLMNGIDSDVTICYDDDVENDLIEPKSRRRSYRPLRRDSVQLYKEAIKEHRRTRRSSRSESIDDCVVISDDVPLADTFLTEELNSESSQVTNGKKQPDLDNGPVHVVLEKEAKKNVGVKFVNGSNIVKTSREEGELEENVESMDSIVDALNADQNDGVRIRSKRKASAVARTCISLMNTNESQDAAKVSTVKRRRKEVENSVEDIYQNKLWREQMPKERAWPAILENPVSDSGAKQQKSRKGKQPEAAVKPAATAPPVENPVRREGSPSNLRYFSLSTKRCSLDFPAEPSRAKLNYRRKRAIQHGWKPLTKKQDAECETGLKEVLDKMDAEISDESS